MARETQPLGFELSRYTLGRVVGHRRGDGEGGVLRVLDGGEGEVGCGYHVSGGEEVVSIVLI